MIYLKFGIGAIALIILYLAFDKRSWFDEEYERNKHHDAPEMDQLKWHIRHMRQDVGTMVFILNGILLLTFILVIISVIKM